MYAAAVKSSEKNKCKGIANNVGGGRRGIRRGFGFVDNRPEAIIQRKLQEISNSSDGIIQNHSKQCGCASCTSTMLQPLQKNNMTTVERVLQLHKCEECGKEKGHLSGCSRHQHNRRHTGKCEHKLGGSHDDGRGYQKKGAKGDRHEKGRWAAQKAEERKEEKK